MPPEEQLPPDKIPLTPQGQLKAAVIMTVCAAFFVLMALICVRSGSPNEALFWLVMTLLSLIGIVDALRKRQKIQQGGSVYYSKPIENRHATRAIWSVGIIFGALAAVAATAIIVWQLRLGPQPYDPLLVGSLLFVWAVLIFSSRQAASRRLFLWSRPPQSNMTDSNAGDYDLPPLTVRDLRGPAISVVGAACQLVCLCGAIGTISHGHIQVRHILAVLLIGVGLSMAMALTYLALVGVLAFLNHKQARQAVRSQEITDALSPDTVWPPPPTCVKDEKAT